MKKYVILLICLFISLLIAQIGEKVVYLPIVYYFGFICSTIIMIVIVLNFLLELINDEFVRNNNNNNNKNK